MLNKYKYKQLTGGNINIKVNLIAPDHPNAVDDSINTYKNNETIESINNSTDNDVVVYKFARTSLIFGALFYNNAFTSTAYSLSQLGFTNEDISGTSNSLIKSFYTLQIYDSIDEDSQNLLHELYYNGFRFIFTNGLSTQINFNQDDINTLDFFDHYYKSSFLDTITGTTANTYARLYFYNALDGEYIVMENNFNVSLTSEDKLYFPILINKDLKTWNFVDNNNQPINPIFIETTNTVYAEKVNTVTPSISNEKPVTPVGQYFTSDGEYVDNI